MVSSNRNVLSGGNEQAGEHRGAPVRSSVTLLGTSPAIVSKLMPPPITLVVPYKRPLHIRAGSSSSAAARQQQQAAAAAATAAAAVAAAAARTVAGIELPEPCLTSIDSDDTPDCSPEKVHTLLAGSGPLPQQGPLKTVVAGSQQLQSTLNANKRRAAMEARLARAVQPLSGWWQGTNKP